MSERTVKLSGIGSGIIPDVSMPHSKFPFWTRAKLYDWVTRMFLDCWDDAEVAETFSAQVNRYIEPHVVTRLREEAAEAATQQPPDVRRRWIYRFSHLTVNNLVKEYMCLEGKTDFVTAKRELGEDVYALAQTVPPNQLCIAINDALGRNNVGMDIIHELQAYMHRTCRMEALVQPYAAAHGMTLPAAMLETAEKVNGVYKTEADRRIEHALPFLAEHLSLRIADVEPADIEYLLDYRRLSGAQKEGQLASTPFDGKRVLTQGASVLEQAVTGTARHIPSEQLKRLVERLREEPVMGNRDLAQVRDYATRHLKDIETLRELGHHRQVDTRTEKLEIQALNAIVKMTDRHLSLLDHRVFFSGSELRRAARKGMPAPVLQALLDRLNGSAGRDEAVRLAKALTKGKDFDFPLDRYVSTRFTIPA